MDFVCENDIKQHINEMIVAAAAVFIAFCVNMSASIQKKGTSIDFA